jgi:hypothetical protein
MLSPEEGLQKQTSCTRHLEDALVVDRYKDSSGMVEDALYISIKIESMIFLVLLRSKDQRLLKIIKIEAV